MPPQFQFVLSSHRSCVMWAAILVEGSWALAAALALDPKNEEMKV